MEKEKNKSKSHPFAGHLRSTEEVLWMSPQAEPTFWERYRSTLFSILPIAGFIVYGMVNLRPQGTDFVILMGALLMMFACTFIPMLGYASLKRWVRGNQRPDRIYAVTNERLLSRNKNDVSSIALESVPSVSLFLGNSTTGAFSFGALFPMWEDVEDAMAVKHLIEDARKQHLNDLKA